LTAGGGVKIHRQDCPNAPELRKRFGYRIVRACWDGKGASKYTITLRVVGNDDIGIVNNLTSIISKDERLTLRTASGTLMVDVKDIAYFKADGNYSRLFTFSGSSTVLHGLGVLEKMLSPEVFVRADRSTLVNIHLVASLQPRQRRCVFRSPSGQEIATTLLAPAFKRLQELL
jgi:DNA-binding LytR/AlgR family response regulator